MRASGPPTADTILINGKNVGANGGSYDLKTLTPGKKHLVRFINTGTNNYFHVSLDGHPFQVVGADFNAVTPFTTTDLTIGMFNPSRVVALERRTDNTFLV